MPCWDEVEREQVAGGADVQLADHHVDALTAMFVLDPERPGAAAAVMSAMETVLANPGVRTTAARPTPEGFTNELLRALSAAPGPGS